MLIVVMWLLVAPFALFALYGFLDNRKRQPGDTSNARLVLTAIVAAVAVASAGYRLLIGSGLGQTAALFIGIPALLAIVTAFAPAKSATGVAMKSVTIGLLISLIFLDEGMLCVLLSAPLFYLVALLLGWAIGEIKTPEDRGRLTAWIPILAIVPMSLEGVTPITTLNRDVTVSETRIVHASSDEVAAAVVAEPRFERLLPASLTIGFPRPIATRTDGRRWVVRMRGGEMRLNGMEPRSGNLVLERDQDAPGMINWTAVSDDSHMRHFLSWRWSRVEWAAIDAYSTRVTWTLSYRRDLDPAWYFGPMERYAARLAAGYLIDAVATP